VSPWGYSFDETTRSQSNDSRSGKTFLRPSASQPHSKPESAASPSDLCHISPSIHNDSLFFFSDLDQGMSLFGAGVPNLA